ncbi:MAG: DUF4194 domain-containing protein [Gammaproteobacteria bacterium]|nr:DUF4194 domain-containing protein [Gammaproteobacteria bacterium]
MNGEQPQEPAAIQPDLSSLVVPLLKGVIYRDESTPRTTGQWNALLDLQARVRDYVSVLGLDLVLDEAEGYAFLRARVVGDDEAGTRLPRLVARRPLSFPVSLLLALLRKKLAEFDAGGGQEAGSARLVLSREELVELIGVFLPEASNEVRMMDRVDAHINKIVELGFLRRMKPATGQSRSFEVRRILKAFVDAQWLADFDTRLEAYRTHLGESDKADTDA